MALWTIRGGTPLYGTVPLQGSVNSALAVLAGALLHNGITVLENVPRVEAVQDMLALLECLHCTVKREGNRVTLDSRTASPEDLSACKGAGARPTILLLGAMIGRFGKGSVPMPQGCLLGPRPLDIHLAVLERLGAQLSLSDSHVSCFDFKSLGGEITLPYPSVGATEQVILAACGGEQCVMVHNCAVEPEVEDLVRYLCACGHDVVCTETGSITIHPSPKGDVVYYKLIPDRVAASALLCAVAACGGELRLEEVIHSHLHPILDVLGEMGCNISWWDRTVCLCSHGKLWAPTNEIVTGAYPAFPTDMQPALLGTVLRADGVTVVKERVMAGRLSHAKQLRRFGGSVSFIENCTAVITGVSRLNGADVRVRDVQGGVALLIAALQAEGESHIVDDGVISRYYEYLDSNLRRLGANLEYTD